MFRSGEIEYVDNPEEDNGNINYVRSNIKMTETSLTVRLTLNITPDFTIQYYGQPFLSAAKYKKLDQ